MGRVAEGLREIEVGFVAGVVVAGQTGDIVGGVGRFRAELLPVRIPRRKRRLGLLRQPLCIGLLPRCPVIVIASLDLVRGGGGSPEEAVRKLECGHRV